MLTMFSVISVGLLGSCVLKASVDRVSVDTIGRYGDRHSADISTDTRPICRLSVVRVSVECWSSVGRHVVLVNRPSADMSVDTLPTPRPICCDRQSLVYRSTVGEVLVDC